MSSTVSTTVGNMVVVTHVLPANANAAENTQQLVGVQKFIKGRPQALGTIQIIIGLMILLFGIAMTPEADTLGIYSGIFVWGAAFYITAGSLTVAAGRRPSRCLVNCAMAFSIVAVVTAVTATILYSLDGAGISIYCGYYGNYRSCYKYMSRMMGVSGVLAVFNALQLIVSAVVIGYACCAKCCCGETPSVIVVPAGSLVTGQTAAPYTEEIHNVKQEAGAMAPPYPPAYNTVVN
ncbi:membrane-spanning 4-domains subfamily A member 4A-like [Solea senegalensis]|uniref:Membrane-spanning 4-domains subfamily A member 4A-like n=1 Tax=Solea senegalensis TaxID=28829 RepID=A0AAV6QND6_SOLSE|nr:membrane-spanning 4-domains subfamily A member 4A-like [Solea senegalensis]KAG7494200.1 membrane-spanning 4-domains subfamily A member 4A-like [Solea senegalensis]